MQVITSVRMTEWAGLEEGVRDGAGGGAGGRGWGGARGSRGRGGGGVGVGGDT